MTNRICRITVGVMMAGLVASVSGLPSVAAAEDERPTVAVLYFDYDGPDEELASLRKGLAQMLVTDLADSVRMVERSRLQEVLDELKLAASRRIDKSTAAKVGRLLGARYLVMGGYLSVAGRLRADARIIEVETGKVLKSYGAMGKPEDFIDIEAKLADGLRATLTALPGLKPAKPRKRWKRPKKLSVRTAARYGKALDAVDKKDTETAKKELRALVKSEPGFDLAARDLDQLIQ